jgi:hypothetical protein
MRSPSSGQLFRRNIRLRFIGPLTRNHSGKDAGRVGRAQALEGHASQERKIAKSPDAALQNFDRKPSFVSHSQWYPDHKAVNDARRGLR